MLLFFVGLILSAIIALIAKFLWRERHEWNYDRCSRCGKSLDDWGSLKDGDPPATL